MLFLCTGWLRYSHQTLVHVVPEAILNQSLGTTARMGISREYDGDSDTADGRNPAPPWMVETLEIMG